jgi:hypothetical protein
VDYAEVGPAGAAGAYLLGCADQAAPAPSIEADAGQVATGCPSPQTSHNRLNLRISVSADTQTVPASPKISFVGADQGAESDREKGRCTAPDAMLLEEGESALEAPQ